MQSEQTTTPIERGRPPLAGRTAVAGDRFPERPEQPESPESPPAAPGTAVGRQAADTAWSTVFGSPTFPSPSPGFATGNLAVWHFVTTGSWESVAGGTDAQVQALADADGSLAVGGWFSRAGDTPAGRVARYDPTGSSWHALGSGLGDGARGGSDALALAYAGESGLWVGGQFPVAGAAPSDNIALYSRGSQ